MGTATIVGTSNTVYVNTPDTITITPNNIDNYFVSNSSPVTYVWKPSSITTKNSMSGGSTRYFHFYLGPSNTTFQLYLGTYSARTAAGKSFTNITPINNSNNVFGMSKCKVGDIVNTAINTSSSAVAKIIVIESSSISDLNTMIGEPVAVGYTRTLSGFAANMVGCNFSTSNPNNIPKSNFGLIKGFSSCTVSITPSPTRWSYTGGVNSGTHYIGTTTSKVSFAGATNTSSSGNVSLTVNPINVSGNLSATSVVSNNLNFSRTDSFSLGETVQSYTNPSISQLSIDRDTTQISLNYSVDTVNKTAIVENSSVTVTKNPITIYYTITNMDTTVSTNGTYTLVADGNSLTNISDNLTFSISGVTLDDNTRYKIEAYLEDRLGQTSNTLTYILPAAFQYIDILPLTSLNGPGIAFGKTATTENAVIFTEDLRPTIENSRAIVSPSTAADNTYFTAKRIANPNSTVYFGIGSGGVNRGIYLDNKDGTIGATDDAGDWLIYASDATSYVDSGGNTIIRPNVTIPGYLYARIPWARFTGSTSDERRTDTGNQESNFHPFNYYNGTGYSYSHSIGDLGCFEEDTNGIKILKSGTYLFLLSAHYNVEANSSAHGVRCRFYNYTDSGQLGSLRYDKTYNSSQPWGTLTNIAINWVDANRIIIPQFGQYNGTGWFRPSVVWYMIIKLS